MCPDGDRLHGRAGARRRGALRAESARSTRPVVAPPVGSSLYVLDMTPEDGQQLVFATGHATVYIGLLPPDNEQGYAEPARSACRSGVSSGSIVTEASVVAVGTPQSFRQQLARSLEVEVDEVGWVQSATAAEELLISAYSPVDVLVLSPEVKEPDALGLAEFVGRTAPGTAIVLVRDHTWNGLLPAAMRAGIRDVVDLTQGSDELREAVERAIVWATNLRSANVDARSDRRHEGRPRDTSSPCSRPRAGRARRSSRPTSPTAIADVTDEDTAAVDLDVDMGDVFTYFGREPSATVHDLMELGEGVEHDRIREVGVEVAPRTWAFGAPPDPAAETPAGEAVGQVPPGDPQRLLLRGRRRVGRLLGPRARVLRPLGHDLPRHRSRRGRREAPVQGARHAAHDRAARGSGSAWCSTARTPRSVSTPATSNAS